MFDNDPHIYGNLQCIFFNHSQFIYLKKSLWTHAMLLPDAMEKKSSFSIYSSIILSFVPLCWSWFLFFFLLRLNNFFHNFPILLYICRTVNSNQWAKYFLVIIFIWDFFFYVYICIKIRVTSLTFHLDHYEKKLFQHYFL